MIVNINFTNEKHECFEKSVSCPIPYKLHVEEWAVNLRTHFLTGVLAVWTDTHNQGNPLPPAPAFPSGGVT